MKYTYFGILTLILFSCNQKETSQTETATEETQIVSEVKTEPNLEHQGYQLIKGSDCLSCHSVDKKMAGPSFREIAERYTQEDLEMLSKSIINGGSGNWGEIPMQPHPQLSKEESDKMVEFIMSLKK
ncbi:c-type cytochrome [Riemerella anatipestifer]|uniref:Cytochrome c-551 n=1 Tax=Riemerella anatipestifer TaxID=34085 RepID=A0A1S7DUV2_RIEAN|nr:c-type cytochrome [Riemerella anatipestifer]AQY22848.1 Cytochrome c-551 [Riemerella anatipestifer]MCO4304386.1 c-type cytochrome [Riemerella anatipestifer]MCO7351965.1 c-type cytochrome [Riemerella anatipestifer]MCQ4038989.1 c-type cytochrome [Riemerella anatipestifer]MCT6761359.1 c-type cytochrome [Riemerella anatipestifer]